MILQAQPIVHRPFVYELGRLEITGFGIAVVLGFVIAQIVAQRELARRGHDPEPMGDLVIAAIVGGLIGAKLYYALLIGEPRDFFSRAGFVFWGGLIGGIAVVVAVALYKRLSLMRIADVAGPAIAAAYAIGRTGCWAVGDDYGLPWSGPLAVSFPEGAPPSTAGNLRELFDIAIPLDMSPTTVLAVHPTQLYHVAMALLIFGILWRLRDHRHAEGWLFGVYAALAGVERFLIEFVRAKDDRFFGTFTLAQLIALAFVAVGITWMAMRWRANGRGIYAGAAPVEDV
ncbi:MAG TPA: prolipoprotein diacylglyceryl transferase family protein [Gemmatimonadaceae bacterium]|nr:prolipoprotein diacylglyceryl transferase family protein [Gemmatimonadaceae bacterium]